MYSNYLNIFILCFCIISVIGFIEFVYAGALDLRDAEVRTSGEGLITRVAPGEFLPFSVKLLNFGGKRRVDVTITYQIIDSEGTEVFTESETIAVETTASFVKGI